MLFTSIIYDRAIDYKHQQEIRADRLLADQFYQLVSGIADLDKIKLALAESIAIKTQHVNLFAILDKESNVKSFYGKKTFKKNDIAQVLSLIKTNKIQSEGQLKYKQKIYYWFIKDLHSVSNSKKSLLIIYSLSPSVISEFLKFFGLPFFISGFLLCWVMVWASIILSSLVIKLQNQKQILSDQASAIEKARDEALHANSAKSNFLANMSHEIRTPLTSIIGFADSCRDIDQTMSERSCAINTIIKSGNHLMNIINEILDLSKIEAGKLEIEIRKVSLMELLEEVNSFVKVLADEKGLTFGINYTFSLPIYIKTDQLRLKQILLNLCSNAIKFTDNGHVYLNVTYTSQSSKITFEVIDTGIGMNAEQLNKIFMPFEQADSSITRKFGGTGLGLTLSKQLVEMLNGELTVESLPNNGSHFTINITMDEIENNDFIYNDKQISIENQSDVNTEIPKLSGRVLVAEDNEDIRALVRLILSKTGIDLDMVENGKDAVNKANEKKYDLILMDVQMPVMDGLTAVKELRENGYILPIVVMTANAMQKDREECIEAGFDSFISKPINRKDLYQVVSQHLMPSKASEGEKIMLTSDLLNEDPDLIDLIDKFMSRLPGMRDAINQAHTDQQNEELSSLIHQMKGVGGGYGYPMLTQQCAKIEFQVANENIENVVVLVEEFNQIVEQILEGKDENHKIAEQAQF